jgi:uncharacterized protein YkwD
MRVRTTARRRAALAIVTSATLVLGIAQAPSANASDRYARKLLTIINRTRVHHDLHRLKMELSLNAPSRRHTADMIDANRLYDPPNLERLLADYRWDDLGADVVGCGNTLKELHHILMTEDFHRTILLHPKLRRVGLGVLVADDHNRCGRGSFWANEIMYG